MLIKIVESRQLKFFGHVIRKEELEEIILSGHINGKRSKGRHRKTYADEISEKVEPIASELQRKEKSGNFYGKPMSETRHGTLKKKLSRIFKKLEKVVFPALQISALPLSQLRKKMLYDCLLSFFRAFDNSYFF